jgi:hypothetical protein
MRRFELAPAHEKARHMRPFQILGLTLACFSISLPAAAQTPGDINISGGEHLEFQVRMSISPGTEQVYCYQQDRLRVVGSVNIVSGSDAVVPIALPDPVIRCSACNTFGCSSLSSNSAVVVTTDPLDFDQSGVINVNDLLMCYDEVRNRIY